MLVAQRHLEHALGNAADAEHPGGAAPCLPLSSSVHAVEHRAYGCQSPAGRFRSTLARSSASLWPACLAFGRDDVAASRSVETAKETSVGRNVQFLKRAAHASPCRRWRRRPARSCARQRAQQRRDRACPSARVLRLRRSKYSWKVRQHVLRIAARPPPAWHTDSTTAYIRAVVGALLAIGRVEAPGHAASRSSVSPCSTGSLATMACIGGQLVLAAEGHQHRARADGGVKALDQAPSGSRRSGRRRRLRSFSLGRFRTGDGRAFAIAAGRLHAHGGVLGQRRWSSGTRG